MLLLESLAILILAALASVYLTALCAQLRLGRRRRYFSLAETFPPAQQWPLISVLVPAYNEERVISATVSSLLTADYPEVEIIVIDDGSSDRTADIVTTIAAGDTRVKLIRQPQNSGKASALNAGVAQAKSEYLVVIDADTVADPDFLKLIVAPLLRDEADAVAGNVKVGNKRHGLLLILQSMEYSTPHRRRWSFSGDHPERSWRAVSGFCRGEFTVWRREADTAVGLLCVGAALVEKPWMREPL